MLNLKAFSPIGAAIARSAKTIIVVGLLLSCAASESQGAEYSFSFSATALNGTGSTIHSNLVGGSVWSRLTIRLEGGDAHVNTGGEASTANSKFTGETIFNYSRATFPLSTDWGVRCATATNVTVHVTGSR